MSCQMSTGPSQEEREESGSEQSEQGKTELWRSVTERSKVIETYYMEGNFYHDVYIEELASLADTSHKNVRDTLSRLRKRDERAGKYVPPPPRQQYEFTDEQRQVLEEALAGEFAHAKQTTTDGTKEISRITGLTVKQVNNWFCNQRRKADGRSAEKDKKRRERMREERISKGLARVSVFSQKDVAIFESHHLLSKIAELGGENKYKIPYSQLVEETGMDRKKIRDWFSKRKLRNRKIVDNLENESVQGEEANEKKDLEVPVKNVATEKPQETSETHETVTDETKSTETKSPEPNRPESLQTILNNMFVPDISTSH